MRRPIASQMNNRTQFVGRVQRAMHSARRREFAIEVLAKFRRLETLYHMSTAYVWRYLGCTRCVRSSADECCRRGLELVN